MKDSGRGLIGRRVSIRRATPNERGTWVVFHVGQVMYGLKRPTKPEFFTVAFKESVRFLRGSYEVKT